MKVVVYILASLSAFVLTGCVQVGEGDAYAEGGRLGCVVCCKEGEKCAGNREGILVSEPFLEVSVEGRYIKVCPVIRVVASPQDYEQKIVVLEGYARLVRGEAALYPLLDYYEHIQNASSVEIDGYSLEGCILSAFNGYYVRIAGTFSTDFLGVAACGTLSDIFMIEAVSGSDGGPVAPRSWVCPSVVSRPSIISEKNAEGW